MSAAAAVLTGCPAGTEADFDPDAVAEDATLFPRTPMAGDMTETTAVFTLFVADGQEVTLRIWPDGDPTTLVDDRPVQPDADGFAKVRVDGLTGGTWYQYAWFAGPVEAFTGRSLIGRVKTALPAGSTEPVTIALSSCVGQGTVLPDYVAPDQEAPFEWPFADTAAELDFDIWVSLGDMAYMDQIWIEEANYQDYLRYWGFYHGGGWRKVFPKSGLYVSWDDHEVTDNGFFDPWDMDAATAARVEEAQRAFYRVVPIDADDPAVEPMWRNFVWGDTVEVLITDNRYELAEDRLVSPEQLAFIVDRITNFPPRFLCICVPKPFMQFATDGDIPGIEDRWEGHPNDRQAVLDAIEAAQARGVIFVAGDLHFSYLGTVNLGDDSVAGTRHELCVTSGNIRPQVSIDEAQVSFNSPEPTVPLLTFDPDAGTITVTIHSPNGLLHEQVLTDV